MKQMAHPRNGNISFLIEGVIHADKPHQFPEVVAAVNLAKKNNYDYFDSISSYNAEHIGAQLKNKDEKEQKAILLGIYLDFVSEGSSEKIIETLLKEPYQTLIS